MNRLLLVMGMWACLCSSPASAGPAETVRLAHKIGMRLGGGAYLSQGASSSSTITAGGLSVVGNYFVVPRFSLSLGYRAEFDYINLNIPLHGVDVGARWYFKGDGTRVTRTYDSITTESIDRMAWYLGTEFIQRSYYIPGVPSADLNVESLPELNGVFYGINATLGMDYRINRSWEMNVDTSVGLVTFAASDDQVKIRGILVNLGISYLW